MMVLITLGFSLGVSGVCLFPRLKSGVIKFDDGVNNPRLQPRGIDAENASQTLAILEGLPKSVATTLFLPAAASVSPRNTCAG
jgi:hypothetical protein